jgi:glutathione synthase
MTVRLAVVMDPIASITYKKDSTLAMLLAAAKRGWELWYIELEDLYLEQSRAMALMRPLKVFADPSRWFELGEAQRKSFTEVDVVLMRKDPPFDTDYIYSTYILERAEEEGCLVVNKPRSLRDCNEKFFATAFPQCTPPTLVTCRKALLREFHQEHGDVIFKPLEGMGGSSIFRLREDDPNVSVVIELLTRHESTQIMAQKYIPEIRAGDKRILMVDGEHVGYALARIPAPNETRGNLAAGGSARGVELSERDRWICAQVGPELKARGLMFVGLDVIGDYLTEVNVTSPTCIRELDAQFGIDIGGRLMDCIAGRLQQR